MDNTTLISNTGAQYRQLIPTSALCNGQFTFKSKPNL